MSAAIDRLRQIAAAWHRAVHVDSSTVHVHICDLDAVLADVSAERTRAVAAEADRDHWRAQATMAAPCVDAVRAITLRLIPGGTGCVVDPERVVAAAHGLASELDAARRAATFAEMERDTLRGLTDAMREDNVRLRGIVAGRETAPTDAELTTHHDEGGQWLVIRAASPRSIVDTLRSVTDVRAWARSGTPLRWLPLDASGRPCPWPTPALGATGEGR